MYALECQIHRGGNLGVFQSHHLSKEGVPGPRTQLRKGWLLPKNRPRIHYCLLTLFSSSLIHLQYCRMFSSCQAALHDSAFERHDLVDQPQVNLHGLARVGEYGRT